MELTDLPPIVQLAWESLGDARDIGACEETSPGVSTNGVYHLKLITPSGARAGSVFAKVSSYGSYVHFRQDHVRIARFNELLASGPYARLLAPVLGKRGEAFTLEHDGSWVVFYGEVQRRSLVPKILSDAQIDNLAAELARFHLASAELRGQLAPTWKTLGSDIASLYDQLDQRAFCEARRISAGEARFLKAQCDAFLENAEALGYHAMPHIPVLIDWNRGNFSVQYEESGDFTLYSRWDYDWFRIEPRTLDFYSLSRVVRAEGDQSTFSYLADPLFEPRFARFLSAYHAVSPLTEDDVLFLKEAYRFFVLNYVVRSGQHFFVPEIDARLSREAIDGYLPALEQLDFKRLWASCAETAAPSR
jgi:Ser/Thr protein kinase RdoA (MazF antagonist)